MKPYPPGTIVKLKDVEIFTSQIDEDSGVRLYRVKSSPLPVITEALIDKVISRPETLEQQVARLSEEIQGVKEVLTLLKDYGGHPENAKRIAGDALRNLS